ncbi:MAG TPA: hypothetical protein VMH81_28500 [Bryobacteraceae bacterium]|nr:hypothetical protein [Bryobacteraceae bacterium]
MRKKWIWLAPLAIVALAAFIALGGVIVQSLWNWLLPPLFGWSEITFWQGLALLALCRILFGGLGGHGPRGPRMGRRMADRMEKRMADRWEALTPEERERFRQSMRGRCGLDPAPSEGQSA